MSQRSRLSLWRPRYKEELDFLWEWTLDPQVPEPKKIAETLLQQSFEVFDSVKKRLVAIVTFKKSTGESRLPVAVLFDIVKGKLLTETIEKRGPQVF